MRRPLAMALARCVPSVLRRTVDRRCRFHDLAKLHPRSRQARHHILQFYSSVDNIGNYLPVLGIHKLLGTETDAWCMHDRNIDFDFINSHYRGVIIGGAGLLHKCFEPCWQSIAERLKLPMMVWGVGGCFVDGNPESVVSRSVGQRVLDRCDLVNVRDDITAEYYGVRDAHIAPCPAIAYVERFRASCGSGAHLLFSSHEQLVSADEKRAIQQILRRTTGALLCTDNIQRPRCGLDDILRRYYCQSRLVVTTRLHGAIIAYGLHIPYVAVARDEKIRAFHRLYANGLLVDSLGDLEAALGTPRSGAQGMVQMGPVSEFGGRARNWLATLGVTRREINGASSRRLRKACRKHFGL